MINGTDLYSPLLPLQEMLEQSMNPYSAFANWVPKSTHLKEIEAFSSEIKTCITRVETYHELFHHIRNMAYRDNFEAYLEHNPKIKELFKTYIGQLRAINSEFIHHQSLASLVSTTPILSTPTQKKQAAKVEESNTTKLTTLQQYLKLKAKKDDLSGKIRNFDNRIAELVQNDFQNPSIEKLEANVQDKKKDLDALKAQIQKMEKENIELKKEYEKRLEYKSDTRKLGYNFNASASTPVKPKVIDVKVPSKFASTAVKPKLESTSTSVKSSFATTKPAITTKFKEKEKKAPEPSYFSFDENLFNAIRTSDDEALKALNFYRVSEKYCLPEWRLAAEDEYHRNALDLAIKYNRTKTIERLKSWHHLEPADTYHNKKPLKFS